MKTFDWYFQQLEFEFNKNLHFKRPKDDLFEKSQLYAWSGIYRYFQKFSFLVRLIISATCIYRLYLYIDKFSSRRLEFGIILITTTNVKFQEILQIYNFSIENDPQRYTPLVDSSSKSVNDAVFNKNISFCLNIWILYDIWMLR